MQPVGGGSCSRDVYSPLGIVQQFLEYRTLFYKADSAFKCPYGGAVVGSPLALNVPRTAPTLQSVCRDYQVPV